MVNLHNHWCTSMLVFFIVTFWEISLFPNHCLQLLIITSSLLSSSVGGHYLFLIIIFCCWSLPLFYHRFMLVMGTSCRSLFFIGHWHLLPIIFFCWGWGASWSLSLFLVSDGHQSSFVVITASFWLSSLVGDQHLFWSSFSIGDQCFFLIVLFYW
jgi:hypothetical protein